MIPLHLRAYRRLLALFPRRFRVTHAEQLEHLFLDNWEEHRARHWGAKLRFTILTVVDVASSAAAVRLRAWFRPRTAPPRNSGSSTRLLAGTIQDLRYATRYLIRARGFTAIVVVILSLGIGANTTMFTIVNGIFFQTPPLVQSPEQMVGLSVVRDQRVGNYLELPDYEFYREHNRVFSAMLGYSSSPGVVTASRGNAVFRATAWMVSENYFGTLGVEMAHGRAFLPDERRTTHPVVVISDGLWRRLYGGDPRAIGRPLEVNGRTYTVVGVAPLEFRGTDPVQPMPDIYVPVGMHEALMPGSSLYLRVLGRLRPDIDIAAAQANMNALSPPDAASSEPRRIVLYSRFHLRPHSANELGELLTLWALILGAVLVIAGANVAILLLARASSRQREMGIRAALGAGRSRIVRQLLTESLLLSLIGGAGGLTVAFWGADLASTLIPLSFSVDFTPDALVIGFALALALVTTVLFGLVPAWQQSRADIASFLHRTDRVTGRIPLRNILVIAQLALSVVLATGAGLLVRSVWTAKGMELGFDPQRRLLLSVELANHGYVESTGHDFVRAMLERFPAIAGVERATTTTWLPFSLMREVDIRTAGAALADTTTLAGLHRVGPHYFGSMGIPLIAGRDFTTADDESGPPAVIVNETLAERVWPGENAIGKTVVTSDREALVVGVAANTLTSFGPTEPPRSHLYVPQFQDYESQVTFIVATRGNPMAVVRHIEQAMHSYDPAMVIERVRTLQDIVDRRILPYRLTATFASLFGALALFLAAVGLYGVQSFLVARRAREIGIRMALGAVHGQVARVVLHRGLTMTAIGIALGVVIAVTSATVVESMLFGVSARDPLTFVTVPIVLLSTAALASWIPAWRASRIDPVVALRNE
jgi:predicted permease